LTSTRELLRSRWLFIAVLALTTLVYPLALLAGGGAHFPSGRDCSPPATHDGSILLVLGTFDSVAHATPFLDRVKEMGFVQAEAAPDGCGDVRVAVPGYPTLAGAESAAGEARRAGLRPELVQSS
jgi:hypothetical protein